jgi:hypothetical protein
LTKEDVQRIGQVIFCTGGVYFTVQTGGAAALVVFNAGQCGFFTWMLMDP